MTSDVNVHNSVHRSSVAVYNSGAVLQCVSQFKATNSELSSVGGFMVQKRAYSRAYISVALTKNTATDILILCLKKKKIQKRCLIYTKLQSGGDFLCHSEFDSSLCFHLLLMFAHLYIIMYLNSMLGKIFAFFFDLTICKWNETFIF